MRSSERGGETELVCAVDLRSGMEHYMKAIVARNNFSEAHNNLGITYTEVGRSESALASFDRALLYQPTLADAHYNRANVLKDAGQVAAAITGSPATERLSN